MLARRSSILRLTLVLSLAASAARAGSFVLDPPSPSWPDSNDILRDRPGPVAALPRPGISAVSLGLQAQDVIDALSDGRDPVDGERHPGDMHLIFSVSRDSAGLPGTAVRQERVADTVPPAGAQPRGHAADLFVWDGVNGVNALAPSLLGWSLGSQTGDEANAHLQLPSGGQPGDDVIAYDRGTLGFVGPGVPPMPIYFSLRIGSPTLAMIGATGGDVLAVGGPFGAVPVIYIPHAALALPPWVDMDALNLEEHKNAAGLLAPWRLRFSVSSATLGFALPNGSVVGSGADILVSSANGASIIGQLAVQLGLRPEDDVDALESAVTQDGAEMDDDLSDLWILESSGKAFARKNQSGDGVDVSEIGQDGDDGATIEFPPALGVSARISTGEEGIVRVQPLTPHDMGAQHLLPYIEQDNLRKRIALGVKGKAEGWVGTGAEASVVLTAWQGDEQVYTSRLDSMSEMGETESLRVQLDMTHANGIIAILIGLLAPAPGSLEAVYDIRLRGNGLAVVPGSGITADRVEIRIRHQDATELDARSRHVSGLEITAARLDKLQIDALEVRRGLLSRDAACSALGNALVGEAVEDGVEVTGLGPDGEDGLRVETRYGTAEAGYGARPVTAFPIPAGALDSKAFSSRFSFHVTDGATGNAIEKIEIANERIERVYAVFIVREATQEGGSAGDGGGAGLLSSPLGVIATQALPVQIRLSQKGLEMVYEEEVSFVPADGSAERRGKNVAFGDLWASSASLEAVEIRAAGIHGFRVEVSEEPGAPGFLRGDADGSSRVELTDAIATLDALFLGHVELRCLDAADANDDGKVSLVDAIYTLNALFVGKVEIPAPGRLACGVDPTKDELGCEAGSSCR